MGCNRTFGIVLLLLVGIAAGCDDRGKGEAAPGGNAGSDLSAGGAGGTGGRGDAGSGGAGGSSGLSWLDDNATWRDLPAASSEEAQIRVREAVPGALRFPAITWSECGSGCEMAEMDQGFGERWLTTLDTVDSDDGPRVVSAFLLPFKDFYLRRFVDLRTGATPGALRLESTIATPAVPPYAGRTGSSPYLTTLYSNKMFLRAIYDGKAGAWDFKLPWTTVAPSPCERWSLDSSPPTLFFGCMKVSMLAAAGSNERTTIEESENFGAGAANAGLSVWSEIFPGPPASSRIRAWSPEAGSRLVVESMPGTVCEVAVSESRITGLRSGNPAQAAHCDSLLEELELWSVSRSGGEITSWRLPITEPTFTAEITTWGDYAAAMLLLPEDHEPIAYADRTSLWLVRLTDGKMRRMVATPGYEWRGGLIAMDEVHLYIGENLESANGSSIDRIYRYQLDRFDEIGSTIE